ncbi:HD domain-containing protein [Pseudalkalibacillus decolorationis]|uniref:HD domain-containing protein n=1 Tax=Pseudalkalibacillus decolorationis TaxID=163879 RepID=UPI002148D67C|nr:HD domain-containing protein [Pseudalkalibacillus decolorationis]
MHTITEILKQIEDYVKEKLQDDTSGHDWFHIERVRKLAITISEKEQANRFICEAAALLHDVIDDKIVDDEEQAVIGVEELLNELGVAKSDCIHIIEIITTMSFKGGSQHGMSTIEGKVVQDADRIDALGAIGIARTFMYAGAKGHPMHDPKIPPRLKTMSKEEYRNGKSTAMNHFYEKLLKLKSRINTETALQIAEERHTVIEQFVEDFLEEWQGDGSNEKLTH